MKKKFALASLMFAFIMCIMPNVYAYDENAITTGADLQSCVGEKSICTLGENITDLTTFIKIEKDVTINLNGHTLYRSNGTVIYVNGSSANLTIKDSAGNGLIDSGGSSTVFADNGATLTIDSNVKINNTGNTKESVAVVSNISTTLTINNGATITATNIAVQAGRTGEQGCKAVINGGTISGGNFGITVFGNNSSLEVKGGNISSTNGNAISGNGSETVNSTITISGGNLSSPNNAVIYNPQSGTLTMTGGTLNGVAGIVARQGTIDIKGGTIKASGEGVFGVGDVEVELPGGTALIVDNTEDGYPSTAKATISGPVTINATNENPILAYGDENNEDNSIVVNVGVKFTGTDPKDVYLAKGLIVDENGKVVDSSSLKPGNNPKNPNTSDSIIYSVIAIIISTLGLTFVLRKLHNN